MDWKVPRLAVDTETTGLDIRGGDRPFAVSACDHQGNTFYWQWEVDPDTRIVNVNPKDVREIKSFFYKKHLIFHNAKFDVRALASIGIGDGFNLWKRYDDVLLASHVMDSREQHGLKGLAKKYFNIDDADETELHERVQSIRRNEAKHNDWRTHADYRADFWLCNVVNPKCQLVRNYAIKDVERTMLLWLMYYTLLEREGLYTHYRRERTLQRVVYRLESKGVTINKNLLDEEYLRYSKEATKHQLAIDQITRKLGWEDFNLKSGPQLQKLLFTAPLFPEKGKRVSGRAYGFQLTPTKATKSGFSTDKHVLPELHQRLEDGSEHDSSGYAKEFLTELLQFRKHNTAATYLNGYLERLYRDHPPGRKAFRWRLFPNYKQVGTRTTRFSSEDPNSQNVGKGDEIEKDVTEFTLRRVFGPDAGRIWYAIDYNQLQLRIFAAAAKEQKMIEAFLKGYDFHNYIASQIFECDPNEVTKLQRRVGKNVNFGYIFGAKDYKIDMTSGMKGLSKRLKVLFPAADEFMKKTIEQVEKKGYINTLGGYRLYVPRDQSYAGVCYIVQGTEGELVKNAMIDVDDFLWRETADESFITLQVHDELVFDFPAETHSFRRIVESHLPILKGIAKRMMKAGANLGIHTPVSCERIVHNWAEGVKEDLGPMEVRGYVQTGMYAGQYYEKGGGAYSAQKNAKVQEARRKKRILTEAAKKATAPRRRLRNI